MNLHFLKLYIQIRKLAPTFSLLWLIWFVWFWFYADELSWVNFLITIICVLITCKRMCCQLILLSPFRMISEIHSKKPTLSTHHFPHFHCSHSFFSSFLFFFFFFFFFWLHLQHMEIPRPGMESEQQLWPTPQLLQPWILNPTYQAWDRTCASAATHTAVVRSLIHCATVGTPLFPLLMPGASDIPLPVLNSLCMAVK